MTKILAVILAAALLVCGASALAQDNDAGVEQKLDTIIENQEAILAQISALKEELRIVKIRVTQAQ